MNSSGHTIPFTNFNLAIADDSATSFLQLLVALAIVSWHGLPTTNQVVQEVLLDNTTWLGQNVPSNRLNFVALALPTNHLLEQN